jgi:pimeloyl-ACP methyl ester carboxylesterase
MIGAYALLCFVLAYNYVHPAREKVVLPSGFRDVLVPTRFGPTPSWETAGFESGHPTKLVFVLAHGYGGSRASWSELMQRLADHGFDSLALSMPGQDQSPEPKVGFGVLESQEIVDAVAWIRKQYPSRKVVVMGASMGGAAAWLATRGDPQIDGIITDSAYAQFDEAMTAFFDRKLPRSSFLFTPVVWIAKRMAGVDPSKIRPVDAASLWRGKPGLVIQGAEDRLVVPSQGERLASAAACALWLVPGATHVRSYFIDPEGYLSHVVKFAKAVESKSK